MDIERTKSERTRTWLDNASVEGGALVTTLADVTAGLQNAMHALSQAQDAGDSTAMAALFTPDGVIEIPGMEPLVGTEQIESTFGQWKPQKTQRHMNVNLVVTEWDDAAAKSTSDVVFIVKDETGWSINMVARYYDEFVRDGDKWLFARRVDEFIAWDPPPGMS